MVTLANLLGRLNPAKILVAGDFLLDIYTIGRAKRISPEAPVPIVQVEREEYRPGGAGNVVLNLLSLGADVVALGRVGDDWAGQLFLSLLEKEGVRTDTIISQEGVRTPVKNRILADHQQMVRIDHESLLPLSYELESKLIERLPALLQEVQVVAISDYGKGLLTPRLLSALIQEARQAEIPVMTDPKGHDFTKYRGSTLIKPNQIEAYAVANLPLQASLESVAARLLEQTAAQLLMITRAEEGISLFDREGNRSDFPVQAKEVKDVTGAGDTVLAMLAYAVANQLSYGEAAHLCNVAASIAIEHVGCARVTLSDLAHRLFERDFTHKIFDLDHLFVLQQLLKGKPFNLLVVPAMEELTIPLFQKIQSLSQEGGALLLHVEDQKPREAFVQLLASLREVHFIVVHPESLTSLCPWMVPQHLHFFRGIYESQCSFSMGMPA